jgi:chaperone modulatory protein CbpM
MARERRVAGGDVLVLDRALCLTLRELCRASGLHAEAVIALVEHGVLEPKGRSPGEWRFPADDLRRLRTVTHLQQDLHVNVEGAALALELLEEVAALRERVRALEALLAAWR